MATTTTNLGLTKPAGTDAPDIAVINANMDTIDTLAPISGTWTPVLRGSTTAGTATYARQLGKYYKIGKLVYIVAEIQVSTLTGGAGYYIVGGLPFAPSGAAPTQHFVQAVNNIAGAGQAWDAYGQAIYVRSTSGLSAVEYANISSTTYINITGCYMTN